MRGEGGGRKARKKTYLGSSKANGSERKVVLAHSTTIIGDLERFHPTLGTRNLNGGRAGVLTVLD